MKRSPLRSMSQKRFEAMKAGTLEQKPRKPMPKTSKSTGKKRSELAFFLEIYEENKHNWVSSISDQPLVHPVFDDDGKLENGAAFVCQFSHILPKGSYPSMKYVRRNIVLKTFEEHRMWTEEKWKLKGYPHWTWVFEIERNLKIQALS
jgi:hypothetical protein